MRHRRNSDDASCHVCGGRALEGVSSDQGPVCYRHALATMDVPVGEGEEERSCRGCRRMIRRPEDAAYVEDAGFYHSSCLRDAVKRVGLCPKCGLKLDQNGECYSCWGGVKKWIEQAQKSAQAVLKSSEKRLCALCLRHNRLIGPGYPFYPIDSPPVGDLTCSRCFTAICDRHSFHLPKKNVLGISPDDVLCGGLSYRGKATTCEGKLEESIACSVEGCSAFDRNDKDDIFLASKQCDRCGSWVCGVDHEACPECSGVPCDQCRSITPKDDLFQFEEDAYTILDLCETCLGEKESEEQESAWGNWLEGDYRRALESRFSAEGLDLDLSSADGLEDLFKRVQEENSIYWSGTEIDWRAVVMCTPVDEILSLQGVELEGAPVSRHSVFSRRTANALARVDELTASGWGDANRSWRIFEARKASRQNRAFGRADRAAAREVMRRAMRAGGGMWSKPEQRRVLKSLPRTLKGMRTMLDMSDARPEDLSEFRRAARKERNEPDDTSAG